MQKVLASIAILLMLLSCGCAVAFSPTIYYDRIKGPAISNSMAIGERVYVESICVGVPGVVTQINAGRGGGELSIGAGWEGFCAAIAKASILRTWGDPIDTEPDQTYIGVGLDFRMALIYVTGSVYTHLSGSDDYHQNIWSVGFGVSWSFTWNDI